MDIVARAREYASTKHAETNHRYDDKPYAYHLAMVAQAAEAFIRDLSEEEQANILAACWCHDVIEDARETYNDVKAVLGETVAELVYALTNEKGRSRAERANSAYYAGIRSTPYASLVKICDRIANVQHSREQQSRMLAIYRKEFPKFKEQLYEAGQYEAAWKKLANLLDLD